MRWALGAVARHPGLWLEAVRALVALSPDRWWRSFPFVPRLDPAYAAWRITTAYGTESIALQGEDLIAYLAARGVDEDPGLVGVAGRHRRVGRAVVVEVARGDPLAHGAHFHRTHLDVDADPRRIKRLRIHLPKEFDPAGAEGKAGQRDAP